MSTINKILIVLGVIILLIILASVYFVWAGVKIYFENGSEGEQIDGAQVQIEDHDIELAGNKIHYTVSGKEDAQPLVLLQGQGGIFERANAYNIQMHAVLSKHFRVYAPEHPNHRRSDLTKSVWSYDDYSKHIALFIDELGIEHPIIMGQSFGGKLAQIYALDHADQIKLLVVGDPSTSFDNIAFYEKVIKFFAPLGPKLLESKLVPSKLKHDLVKYVLTIPDDRIDTRNYRKYSKAFKSLGESVSEYYSDRLSSLTTPTVIIWGENDAQFPVKQGELLKERLPNAELYIYENATHTAMYQYPQKTLNIILERLEQIN